MFFDLSALDLLVLAALAVVLFGPDRLPEAARTAARLVRHVRALQAQAAAAVDPRALLGEDLAAEVGETRLLAREVLQPAGSALAEAAAMPRAVMYEDCDAT